MSIVPPLPFSGKQLHDALKKLAPTVSDRAPLPSDDETQGYAVGSRWMWQGQEWVYTGARWVRTVDVSPLLFGAVGDGITDDTAAVQAAADIMKDGDRFFLPPGTYAVSSTIKLRSRRCTIHFEGKLIPHGTFDDYLFEVVYAGGADPELINVGNMATVTRLEVDGRWQSRGVKFDNLYLSSLSHVIAYKTFGTAIRVNVAYENTWTQPTMTLCKNRTHPWVASAAAWNAGTSYPIGTYVRRDSPAYSAGTTYTLADVVEHNGRSYRSMRDGNTGNTPGTDPVWWVQVPHEYFRAVASSTGKDPLVSANTSHEGGPWQPVLPHEPVLDLHCDNPGGLIDHQYFYGLDIRDCDARTLVHMDNTMNARPVVNMEFYGAQIHSLTPGIGAASGGQLVEGAEDFVSVRLGRVHRAKFYGANIRLGGQMQNAIGLYLGGRCAAKTIQELVFHGDLSGEAARQVGICAGNSVAPAKQFLGQINNQLVGAGSRLLADPAQRLHNIFSTPQLLPDSSNSRPALAFQSDPATGLRLVGDGVLGLIVKAAEAARVFMIGGNLGMKTALLPEYADDAAAGAGGVIVGQWYRTGSTIKQRAS